MANNNLCLVIRAVRREDGYRLEMATPWTTLRDAWAFRESHAGGAGQFGVLTDRPRAGDVWRWNLVVRASDPDGKLITGSWSSPEEPFHLERNLGTLHGTLVFE